MPNHLAAEGSPYLQLHKDNPVSWYPWGEAAFAAARDLQRPILLSIGYAACHWCHVMERESFADTATAELMNDLYINVKVDREERPDVDTMYVRALQVMGKRVGWPMTVFLRPDGKAFWGGTYFPREAKAGLPAFSDVLVTVRKLYNADAVSVDREATRVFESLATQTPTDGRSRLEAADIQKVAVELLGNVDTIDGGLKGTSKFPYPSLLRFLWNEGSAAGTPECRDAALLTLKKIVGGGIYDHVGGGFFRYTVDPQWRIPHFEKMLCDNAQLIDLLSDVSRSIDAPEFDSAVVRTVEWMLRELQLRDGAFAASLAAESNGTEGGVYFWSEEEIDAALGAGAKDFKEWFGVTQKGNFGGKNVLAHGGQRDQRYSAEDRTKYLNLLLAARAGRAQPARNEQVLTDWNGLAIHALVRASVVFGQDHWLRAAKRAFQFIKNELGSAGRLFHSWNGGVVGRGEVLDDYAQMIAAAISLHEVTGSPDYLVQAELWTKSCIDDFRVSQGAFFHTGKNADFLVVRLKHGRDSAVPSANGVMAECLVRLYFITGADRYRDVAEAVIEDLAADLDRDGYQMATALNSHQLLSQATHVTVLGSSDDPAAARLFHAGVLAAPSHNVVQFIPSDARVGAGHPASGKILINDGATAYVCVGQTCSLPITTPAQLRRALTSQ